MPSLPFVIALDTGDTGGVVLPLAIIAACGLISVVAIVVRRRKARRAVAGAPAGARPWDEAGAAGSTPAPDADLKAWQAREGQHVDRWLDAHERSLPTLVPGVDPAIDAELDEAMAGAARSCPNPDVAALLAGMRDTARATREALTAGDRDAATAAHTAYARDRSDAIARMNHARR